MGVTEAAFVAGGMGEHCVTLVQGNTNVYREALAVYTAVGGTAVWAGAVVPTEDIV